MKKYDVVVIGGGASGLIAAGRAAEMGAHVLLLEKNKDLGIKLLMTGGGRCNFTNNATPRILAEAYGSNGRWLLSGLSRFGAAETIDFFVRRGVEIKEEDNGRVFPKSDNASDILKTLVSYLGQGKVDVKMNSAVEKIISDNKSISKLILSDQTEVVAKKFIIGTGGKTYPLSGSSGEAYAWLESLGHKIITPQAALTPIFVSENISDLEGLSVSGANIKLYSGDKKIAAESGDFIFTRRGLSGPAVLSLSRSSARQQNKKLKIKIDFSPLESLEDLEKNIQKLVDENKQVDIKNILSKVCPRRLVNFILTQAKINPDKKGNGLTRVERKIICNLLKEYPLTITSTGGFSEAMITVGGVDLQEVDPKTMASKIYPNLYLAGELLDLDGPTGGYNLQAAWTTGYLAGENAAK